MKGIAIIFRSEHEFDRIVQFLGKENMYINFVPQMLQRETSIVIYAKKKTGYTYASIGCSKMQRESGIKTIKFNKYFSQ